MESSYFMENISGRNYRLASLVVIASSLIVGGGAAWAFEVQALDRIPKIVSVKFEPPTDEVPRRASGGGSRGMVGFSSPEDNAPTRTMGGGSRGEVGFSSSGDNAPTRTMGGGSRGEVGFSSPDDNAPTRTMGGGSRSEQLLNPTPLIPSSNIGRTVSERPTFFVYIPQTSYKQIFFSLYSEDRQYHYQTTFDLNKTGGVIAIKLPQNAPALEVGKTYQWSVSFIRSEETLLPDSYAVRGWVKRVPAPQADVSMTEIQLATLYGKSGIWYDTLTILSSARFARPEDATVRQEWVELLEQVGLKDLSQQPLTEQL